MEERKPSNEKAFLNEKRTQKLGNEGQDRTLIHVIELTPSELKNKRRDARFSVRSLV